MRLVTTTAALLLGLLLSPTVALAQAPGVLPTEFFRLTPRAGIAGYYYTEDIGDIESDYSTAGPAWGLNATVRLMDRLRVGADYFGTLATSSTETWTNIGTFMGASVDQENDLEVWYHTVDIEGGYSVLKEPGLEVAVWLGWHYYFQGFERSDFRFRVFDLSIPFDIAPVSEDVSGQGVKLGATVDWAFAPRWVLTGGLGGYYLYTVDVDNSELGKLDSEGWAARWRVAVDYAVNPNLSVGVGYEGHYIFVDEAENDIAVLPANQTWINAGMVRLTLRY